MRIEPSSVAGVEVVGPDAAEFSRLIEALVSAERKELLRPALPFSLIVRNNGERALALLGVRFDMVSRGNKPYSVVHYADTLRHPEKSNMGPGSIRFVCAEPRYTDMVLRGESKADQRGAMNLENLASALKVTASLDCVAFSDGEFAGPDSNGAFERLARERQAENTLSEEVRQAGNAVGDLLAKAIESSAEPARRALAKQFHAALAAGELEARVRKHRLRIPLWRGTYTQTDGLR